MRPRRRLVRPATVLAVLLLRGPAAPAGEPGPPSGELGEAETVRERARLYTLRHGDSGKIDAERRRALVSADYARRRGKDALIVGGSTWTSLGPTNGAGRATSIAPHPTTAGTVYVGTADGGVWKTTDGGSSWTPLTDLLSDLSVGAIALAPSNPSVVYLGTGESGGAQDSLPGIGFLSSTNGGAHWQLPASVVATAFFRLSVHPTNALEVVAATNAGALRSTNGGLTWATTLSSTPLVTDLARNPSNAAILYCATWGDQGGVSKVYKSTDSGVTWAEKSTGLPTANSLYNRFAIAIAPSATSTLYAATSGDYGSGFASHAYKSTNSGDTWAELTAVSGSSDGRVANYLGNQAWYDNVVSVAPTDANIVLLAGVDYLQSTDGGSSFGLVSGPPHVDAHDLKYQGATLWIANDGGIYTSANDGNTTTAKNTGLVTRQYYSIALDPGHPNRIMGGTQDNGTDQRQDAGGSTWRNVVGADGMDCPIHPLAGEVAYATTEYGGVFRTENAGSISPPAFVRSSPHLFAGDSGPFFTVLTMAPKTPTTLLTGSVESIYRSTDGGDSWSALGFGNGSHIGFSAIAVAPSDENVLYISRGSFGSGYVYRSTDGGSLWTSITAGLPAGAVNHVAVDPANASTVYASLATTSGASVYRTTDGGATWTPAYTGLPSFAAQLVRVDPTDSNVLYCGTDVGVYRSTDQGGSWAAFGTGLPASSVQDIRILEDGSALRVATHGRGVWELSVPALPNTRPVAAITSPAYQSVAKGTTLLFHGSVSDADGGDTAAGTWTFGDTWRTVHTAEGATNVYQRFDKAGVFSVNLGARDSHGAHGSTAVTVDVPEPADDCATPAAIPAAGPFPYTVLLENQNATAQLSDPLPSCYPYLNSSLWVSFTPSVSGTYSFSTCGTQFDTVVGIYQSTSACAAAAAGQKACGTIPAGTPCAGGGSYAMSVAASAGQKLFLRISSYSQGDVGPVPVHVWLSSTSTTAPRVQVLSPRSGPRSGGTKVGNRFRPLRRP